jgi:hypothetical protein
MITNKTKIAKLIIERLIDVSKIGKDNKKTILNKKGAQS